MNDKALQVQGHSDMDVFKLGEVMAKSGFFTDSKDMAKAAVKILAGRELGIGPVAAMMGIHIIATTSGTSVQLSANLLASLVERSGIYSYKVLQLDDEGCRIEYFKSNVSLGISTFSKQDAVKAGTKNLQKFPRNMYFARAMSNGVKWYCPGVTSGTTVYTEGEIPQEAIIQEASSLLPQQTESPQRADNTPEDEPETIGGENAEKFMQLAERMSWPIPHFLNAALKYHGVNDLALLTPTQAGELKRHMYEKYPVRKIVEEAFAEPAPEDFSDVVIKDPSQQEAPSDGDEPPIEDTHSDMFKALSGPDPSVPPVEHKENKAQRARILLGLKTAIKKADMPESELKECIAEWFGTPMNSDEPLDTVLQRLTIEQMEEMKKHLTAPVTV